MSIERARAYLAAIERGATGDALAAFFHPEATFHELPNRLVESGALSALPAILAGAERGQRVVEDQRYDVKRAYEQAGTVILEVVWSAKLKVPLASTPVGGTLRAHIAMFIEMRDGRIVAQRNYDCYERF